MRWSERLVVGALALLAFGCSQPESAPIPESASAAPPSTPAAPPPPSPQEVAARLHHGIDVSDHSGTVDWEQLTVEGHSFAFAKATEGVDLKDPAFDSHWRQMKEAGLIRGAYHFYVTEDDPDAQADLFISSVTLEPGDLVPVVDVELLGHDTPPGLPDRLKIFLSRLEEHYGAKPIIYTTARFWNEHVGLELGEHPLWIAEYEVEEPNLPNGWETWHLWQWQGDATVEGVEKGADLSKVNRSSTELDLAALVIPPSPR